MKLKSPSIKKLAFQCLKRAQQHVRKIGGLSCIATAYDSKSAVLFDALIDCSTQEYKRTAQLMFQMETMKYHDVAAVSVIAEVWTVPDPSKLTCRPSESPDRVLAISVSVMTPNEILLLSQPFEQKGRTVSLGKIDQTNVVQGRNGKTWKSSFTDLFWPQTDKGA
jgi:hypothetical protein